MLHKEDLPEISNMEDIEYYEHIMGQDIEEEIDPIETTNGDMSLYESMFQLEKGTKQTFHKHQQPVFCCSLSKNGELAATGGQDDHAYVWNTTTGEIVFTCTGHKDSVIFSRFNYNETYLATGDMKGIIKLWQLSDTTCVWSYEVSDISWMTWHHSANVLLAGLAEGQIYMWKLPEGQCKIFQGFGHSAEVGVIFPDGHRLAVGYKDGTLNVLDLKSSAILASIPASPTLGHSSNITTIDCRSDNNLLVSAALDGKTILSTPHNGKIISVLQNLNESMGTTSTDEEEEKSTTLKNEAGDELNKDNWVETAAFCKDPTLPVVATGTIKGELFIWDISKKILRHKLLVTEDYINKVIWKGNTSIIFVAAGDVGSLYCIDAKTGFHLNIFEGHSNLILDLYISEDEKTAITASDDHTARVYDISSVC